MSHSHGSSLPETKTLYGPFIVSQAWWGNKKAGGLQIPMDTYRRIVHHFQAAMASGTLCDWEWIIERELGDLHDIEVREPLEVWENMTAKQKFEVVEAVRLSC